MLQPLQLMLYGLQLVLRALQHRFSNCKDTFSLWNSKINRKKKLKKFGGIVKKL